MALKKVLIYSAPSMLCCHTFHHELIFIYILSGVSWSYWPSDSTNRGAWWNVYILQFHQSHSQHIPGASFLSWCFCLNLKYAWHFILWNWISILLFYLQVASVTFDLLLLLALGSYLIVLFSFLVITTRVSSSFYSSSCIFHYLVLLSLNSYNLGAATPADLQGLDDLISLFRRPPSRKTKSG